MDDRRRERLRLQFDKDAARYDRARPRYPADLFDALHVRRGRVLEIGPGTGQATIPLARRGFHVTAVELGAAMAAIAAERVRDVGEVTVVNASFEDFALPDAPFDTVFAATAFHWVDPVHRFAKTAAALRPGGTLAVVETHHVAGGSGAFFDAVMPLYERFDPHAVPGERLSPAEAIPPGGDDATASGYFGEVTRHRFERDIAYTTAEYLDVLNTYSNHRAMPDADRAALLDGVARIIDTDHGGRITKRYLFELWQTRRTGPRAAFG